MIHILYKITNKKNGKSYIGIHKTNEINDGYLGSGKYIKRAIKKYGVENFDKEIVAYFPDRKSCSLAERKLIQETPKEKLYNISSGGESWDYINENNLNNINHTGDEYKNKLGNAISKALMKNHWARDVKKKDHPIYKSSYEKWLKTCYERHGKDVFKTFKNRKHTEESKKKIGSKNSIHQQGKNNSQYGTCWIFLKDTNKKIQSTELKNWLKKGWSKGRKMLRESVKK